MVTESYDYQEMDKTMMYYSTPLVQESDFPFNFYLLDLPQNNSGWWVKHLVNLWMANMPRGQWANWVVSHQWHFILWYFLGSFKNKMAITPNNLSSKDISADYTWSFLYHLNGKNHQIQSGLEVARATCCDACMMFMLISVFIYNYGLLSKS